MELQGIVLSFLPGRGQLVVAVLMPFLFRFAERNESGDDPADGEKERGDFGQRTSPTGLTGDDGADKMYGDAGNDSMDGGAGNDVMNGGDGDDTMNGGADDDQLFCQNGNDSLHGRDGNDVIYGNAGDDVIKGGEDGDVEYGGRGDDTMWVGRGRDAEFGGPGTDVLHALADDDQLDIVDCGSGNDVAWLNARPLWLRLGEIGGRQHLVVHGGFVPGVPLDDQERDVVLNLRSITDEGRPSKKLDGTPWGSLWRGPEQVTYETLDEGRIARIWLNRPEAQNAQSRTLLVQLDEAFLRAEADDAVMVVILAAKSSWRSSCRSSSRC